MWIKKKKKQNKNPILNCEQVYFVNARYISNFNLHFVLFFIFISIFHINTFFVKLNFQFRFLVLLRQILDLKQKRNKKCINSMVIGRQRER